MPRIMIRNGPKERRGKKKRTVVPASPYFIIAPDVFSIFQLTKFYLAIKMTFSWK